MAIKIFNNYGNDTISIVKNNPYKLVEDIDGIGFLTADKIAKSMGISTNSIFRIRAGYLHTMSEASEKNGNTFLYKDLLISFCPEGQSTLVYLLVGFIGFNFIIEFIVNSLLSPVVLRLVNNVLNCRCTTSDVLRYISTMDIERLYETGLEEFNYSI